MYDVLLKDMESIKIFTNSAEETEAVGEAIGRVLKGGETIELVSDLGGGKTTLTRGIVRTTGSNANVSSPTFTVSKVYSCPNFTIHHYDLYRLNESGLTSSELHELIDEKEAVVIVEWSGLVSSILPEDRLIVEFVAASEFERQITITAPVSIVDKIKEKL